MKLKTLENKLFEAWAYCDAKDKSTEYTFQYMQDTSGLNLDQILNFIEKRSTDRQQWYKENPEWYKKYNL